MSTCDHSVDLTPEMDAAVALVALKEHDLSHAAHHVAGCIGGDPARADFVSLLDQLLAEAGSWEAGADLFPLQSDDGVYFGAVACHARAIRAVNPLQALNLLCQVAMIAPGKPWLDWMVPFAAAIPGELLHANLVRLMRFDAGDGVPVSVAFWSPVCACIEAHVDAGGTEHRSELLSLLAIARRRGGQWEGAVMAAREAYEAKPTWMGAVALANAHRAVGDLAATEAAWRKALEHDPKDVSVRLDWGDTLLDRDDLDGAADRYRQVTQLQAGHPWASASLRYIDWRRSPTAGGRIALRDFARSNPDNDRARQVVSMASPWDGYLPNPSEAITNMLAQQDAAEVGELVVTVTSLECGSACLNARLWVERRGGSITISANGIAQPDLRTARHAAVALLDWAGGTIPSPAVDADPLANEAVVALATTRFSASDWLAHGRWWVQRLQGFGDLAAAAFAATVNPPPVPEGFPDWLWLYRAQHAAAFVIAAHPWETAWPLLQAMTAVRNDWLSCAALAAAVQVAVEQPEHRDDVYALCVSVWNDGPSEGHWGDGWAAAAGVLRLTEGPAPAPIAAALSEWEDPGPDSE